MQRVHRFFSINFLLGDLLMITKQNELNLLEELIKNIDSIKFLIV